VAHVVVLVGMPPAESIPAIFQFAEAFLSGGRRLLPPEDWAGAAQVAVVPPFDPAQVQFQGPLPVTVDGVPALQSLLVGAVLVMTPFAAPHWPFTGGADARGAEQTAVVPPLLPTQLQFQGPLPVTLVAVPALQRLVVGAVVTATPAAVPHEPFMRHCACAGPKTINERRTANTVWRIWCAKIFRKLQVAIRPICIVKRTRRHRGRSPREMRLQGNDGRVR
jgi:hypothetical protein